MVPPEKRPQILNLNLGGLDQAVHKIVVFLTRPGAPPIKPDVVISGQYEENGLYRLLEHTATNVTNVMSKFGWDDGALAGNQELDDGLLSFTTSLRRIQKMHGPEEARKMLEAAIDKIGKSDFFQTLPDRDLKRARWEQTLRKNFDEAMRPPRRK